MGIETNYSARSSIQSQAAALGNATTAYPYNFEDFWPAVGDVEIQSFGFETENSDTASVSVTAAVNNSPSGTTTLFLFSGGAQAANTAYRNNFIDQSKIDYVVYVSPGFGDGQNPGSILKGTKGTFYYYNPYSALDFLAADFGNLSFLRVSGVQYIKTTCGHSFDCFLRNFRGSINKLSGPSCSTSTAWLRNYDGPAWSPENPTYPVPIDAPATGNYFGPIPFLDGP